MITISEFPVIGVPNCTYNVVNRLLNLVFLKRFLAPQPTLVRIGTRPLISSEE